MSDGYGQFCAVARGLETLGERWTLLIVRELAMGSTGFAEIQRGLPRLPPATLSKRLNSLAAAGVITKRGHAYHLTESGEALRPVLRSIAAWSNGPGRPPLDDDHLDPAALTWDMQRRINRSELPDTKVTVRLNFVDRASDRYFWLQLDQRDVSLCNTDPGDTVDVWISAETRPVVEWWLGERTWASLLRHTSTQLDGDRELRRRIPDWFAGYALASA